MIGMPCFRFTLLCWTALNLVLPTGVTISAKSSGSTLPSPIVSKQNQQLSLLSTSLPSGTTVFLGPIIIAVSGIAPWHAAILLINKVWSTSVHIESCPITPLVHAPPAHHLLPSIDYPTRLPRLFSRQAIFHLAFRQQPPLHQPFPFLRSLQLFLLPQHLVRSTFALSRPLACCCYLSPSLLKISTPECLWYPNSHPFEVKHSRLAGVPGTLFAFRSS